MRRLLERRCRILSTGKQLQETLSFACMQKCHGLGRHDTLQGELAEW